ncbi:hypothetical protein HanXRQr2_Chr03g0091781 [Helianthus annuus]|nr:hypothetical protein HanXRQr2_Chr03g0091781 [Helianthus annuus]
MASVSHVNNLVYNEDATTGGMRVYIVDTGRDPKRSPPYMRNLRSILDHTFF